MIGNMVRVDSLIPGDRFIVGRLGSIVYTITNPYGGYQSGQHVGASFINSGTKEKQEDSFSNWVRVRIVYLEEDYLVGNE